MFGSRTERSGAKHNETQRSRVFGRKVDQKVMKQSGAECLEAERSKTKDNEMDRSRMFVSGTEDNETECSDVI